MDKVEVDPSEQDLNLKLRCGLNEAEERQFDPNQPDPHPGIRLDKQEQQHPRQRSKTRVNYQTAQRKDKNNNIALG